MQRLDQRVLSALVALFERTVAIFAELIDVNAYHQPGVEAGKKAAAKVLALQQQLVAALSAEGQGVQALAQKVSADAADCWPILQHLAANRPEVHVVHRHDPERALFSRRRATVGVVRSRGPDLWRRRNLVPPASLAGHAPPGPVDACVTDSAPSVRAAGAGQSLRTPC